MSPHKVTFWGLLPNKQTDHNILIITGRLSRLKNNTKYKAYIWQSYVTVLILPPCLHPKLLPTSFCCILVSIFKSACSYCVGVCHMFSLWISNPFHVTIFGKSSTYPPTLIVFLEVGALKWVLEIWGDISLHKYRKS